MPEPDGGVRGEPYAASVDDPQRQPNDSDRSLLAGRIKRASDDGRISGADRDIRLGNVWTAQSMAELDLMTRELDQLDAQPLPVAASAAPVDGKPWSTFQPGKGDDGDDADPSHPVAGTTSATPASRAALVSVVIAVGALVAAVALFLNFRGTDSRADPIADPGGNTVPGSGVPATPGGTQPGGKPASGAKYSLTGPGIRGFLATYQKRFGTTRVVDLTLYGDYAIVQVPVPGKARQSGWIYRGASGFTQFGGVRAVFPGAQVVDTTRMVIPALIGNIARARTTLNVEAPVQVYVIVRQIAQVDVVPSVDIHVTNQFSESGYLATTLDGKIERSFPYSS